MTSAVRHGQIFTRQSLSWRLTLGPPLVTLCISAAFWGATLFWDYVNLPSRQFHEVVFMWPFATIMGFLVASLAQSGAYVTLPLLAKWLLRRYCQISLLALLAATPVLGVLVWYGYDYLVPELRWYSDERPPFEHGITGVRFLMSWGLEIAIVIGYWLLLRPLRSVRNP
jgi:hypothetical protein